MVHGWYVHIGGEKLKKFICVYKKPRIFKFSHGNEHQPVEKQVPHLDIAKTVLFVQKNSRSTARDEGNPGEKARTRQGKILIEGDPACEEQSDEYVDDDEKETYELVDMRLMHVLL